MSIQEPRTDVVISPDTYQQHFGIFLRNARLHSALESKPFEFDADKFVASHHWAFGMVGNGGGGGILQPSCWGEGTATQELQHDDVMLSLLTPNILYVCGFFASQSHFLDALIGPTSSEQVGLGGELYLKIK